VHTRARARHTHTHHTRTRTRTRTRADTNWKLLEGSSAPAGLACTIKDEAGFYWDIGAPTDIHTYMHMHMYMFLQMYA